MTTSHTVGTATMGEISSAGGASITTLGDDATIVGAAASSAGAKCEQSREVGGHGDDISRSIEVVGGGMDTSGAGAGVGGEMDLV